MVIFFVTFNFVHSLFSMFTVSPSMIFADNKMVILSMGARLPVHFESQVISSSVANLGSLIDAAKIKSRLDYVYALVRVVSTEDDQVG